MSKVTTNEKLPDEELERRLREAGVQVGGRYRHYKGNDYTVTGLAIIEANNEVGVIYRMEYRARLSFIRPLSDWSATVEVGGRQVPRFEFVGK